MSLSKILSACLSLVLSTVVYTLIMFNTDKIDREIIFDKINAAFEDGDLLQNLYPPSASVWTRDNLAGIDQSIESFYALMVMYNDL
jgi:hypothetical protein